MRRIGEFLTSQSVDKNGRALDMLGRHERKTPDDHWRWPMSGICLGEGVTSPVFSAIRLQELVMAMTLANC